MALVSVHLVNGFVDLARNGVHGVRVFFQGHEGDGNHTLNQKIGHLSFYFNLNLRGRIFTS